MQRILIVTDAWHPQVNGVVRTLASLVSELADRGFDVRVVTPRDFRTIPCPTYPEIRLALTGTDGMARLMDAFLPDSVHIATEGPLGFAARRVCLKRGIRFTTSLHTRFPEYLRKRAPIPERWTYNVLRWFHNAASHCLVPTESMRRQLEPLGFRNLVTWTRGIDRHIFRPSEPIPLDLPRPIFLTVSRLAPEKNIEGFLDLDLPGSKLVVGHGPSMAGLVARYPKAHFAGLQTGNALASYYSSADVFVFPSRTDTFGNVIIEALACGVPIAAFPEPGPNDVIADSGAGVISEDLREACLAALSIDRDTAFRRSFAYNWEACAEIFLDHAFGAGRTQGRSDPLAA
ncbi:glycosyltransferase family 4 protein [Jiella avicenniae]|uniref:Glycosyltransferase family 1 protein n=1 Tax=Jiella avicenniae TaxID=2907202 RepID=A0A9X1T4I9_9HYPH|nr:glycosyltransferase family 1 protein [Jiella avicenniae]MCE7027385.1 glycosyltransferase family 1 protein [Jiella avicenniae]